MVGLGGLWMFWDCGVDKDDGEGRGWGWGLGRAP